MAAPRFFTPHGLAPTLIGATLDLPEAVAHHATRVVRLAVGAALTLFDGGGGEYAATLARIDKRGAAVRIDGFDPVERESPLAVMLVQAVVATDAMDYAMRKATEVGVTAIQPLATARSAPLPGGERGDKRHAHWRQIAIAACEQSGRNRVPEIRAVTSLADWLSAWSGPAIALLPDAAVVLPALPAPTAPLALLVGPEGSWDASEIAALRRAGVVTVRLGPRVLRAETAGVAALAAMQALWGDYR